MIQLQLLLLGTLLALSGCAAVGEDEERLIGWGGEKTRGPGAEKEAGRQPWVETISWVPRAFVHHHFLTEEECDHLVNLAKKRLERSMVVGDTGDVVDPIRTSYSASIAPGEDEVVARVEQRIAEWTHLPMEHGEPIEVLRYKNGQKYDAHWDWFEAKEVGKEGNRVATVLMYLSDVGADAGGETALPLAFAIDEVAQSIEGMSECASNMGLSIRPRKGDVLLFWDMKPDGATVDRHSLHASCPTFKGEKWTATKWIHVKSYLK